MRAPPLRSRAPWTERWASLVLAVLLAPPPGAQEASEVVVGEDVVGEDVDFGREVYPLLRDACFDCHGEAKQRGGLRLDSRAAALSGGRSGPVFVPGQPAGSELLRRIALPADDEDVMPARGAHLSAEEIALLGRWIEQGAPWPDEGRPPHWAYLAPVRPPVPEVKAADWPRNAVDAFVLARLEQAGLAPSPEAEPAALVRRLYLDLIGLPPSPEEADEFLRDPDPRAYERLVERLLASPQFGVRWARSWLDCARYADSHGFQADDLRDLWAYRDWVVEALNADMPFDRFTIEQLAGDLLPEATLEQRIATGFNRGAPCNVELGSDPAETRVNQVIDRVNTLSTVWLGTTMGCAQCHDHKYDPFTAREYYGLFAFFDRTAIEADRAKPEAPGSIQFLGPYLDLPDPEVEAQRATLEERRAPLAERAEARRQFLTHPDPAWEAAVLAAVATSPREHRLRIAEFASLGGSNFERLEDDSVLLSGEVPERDTYSITVVTDLEGILGFKLYALTDPSLPGSGPGRGNPRKPAFQLHAFEVETAPADGTEGHPVAFARAFADHAQPGNDAAFAIDGNPDTAWGIGPKFHRPHWVVFESDQPLGFEGGTRFTFRLDQNYGGGRTIGRLRLAALTGTTGPRPIPVEVATALGRPEAERTSAERASLLDFRLENDPEFAVLLEQERKLAAEIRQLRSPTTLVMREDTPRQSRILLRGDFLSPGEPVEPHVPGVFPPLEPRARAVDDAELAATGSSARLDRLDLAQWLVRPENPLTARVTVNRWWSELFGHGLVTTPEDFGVRGAPPTHPELLDWLAIELQEGAWSMKHLLGILVTSATYRQTARVTPELLARDDANLLYARGARTRMDAEMVRDNALAIAGLLDPTRGGPPIRPPQPPGVWAKVGGEVYDYEVSPGRAKYRRGLYVVWKRSAPYPSFVTFDAGPRLTCQVERLRSNTPLQALTLMNDPVYVEAAVAFARRVLAERPAAAPEERIRHAFRLALARAPRPAESQALRSLYETTREPPSGASPTARVFAASHHAPPELPAEEFAAWYAVAAALLNLDETITK